MHGWVSHAWMGALIDGCLRSDFMTNSRLQAKVNRTETYPSLSNPSVRGDHTCNIRGGLYASSRYIAYIEYNAFDIFLEPFLTPFPALYTTPHAPCNMPYQVTMLAWGWLVIAIRCYPIHA